MVLPFGVSIGDFVAVGCLAHKVAVSLNERRGSVAQYESLIELLNSIETALQSVSAFIQSPTSLAGLKLDTAFVNGICYETYRCQKLLERFSIESQKYTDSFLKQKSRSVQREWRKLNWTLYRDDDARKLEQRLRGHFDAFRTYLAAINIQLQIQSTTTVDGQLKCLSRTLGEVASFVHQCQNQPPKTLGYPWQGDNGGCNIFFEDVLGRTHEMPPVFCKDLKTFQDALEIMFRTLPGYDHVLRGHYEIVDAATGQEVWYGKAARNLSLADLDMNDPEIWEKYALPGSKLLMNALEILLAPPREEELWQRLDKRCPRCQNLNHRSNGNMYFTCCVCNLSFRKSVREDRDNETYSREERVFSRADYLQNSQASHSSPLIESIDRDSQSSCNASLPRHPGPTHKATQGEIFVFRRLHHIRCEQLTWYPRESIETGWQYSRSPMVQAAAQGDSQWITQLLADGFDPQSKDYVGHAPIQYAAASGNLESVRALVEAGCNINTSAGYFTGRTALQASSANGHVAMTQYLLELGAGINAAPAQIRGRTAAQAAAGHGFLELVQLLVSRGADVHAVAADVHGRTTLQAAAESGSLALVEYLASLGADVNAEPARSSGLTAIQAAAAGGHDLVVKFLIDAGAYVNTPADEMSGLTALQAAAQMGHEDMLTTLIDAGADVNAPAGMQGGRTALQAAAESRYEGIVKFLIGVGADVNAPAYMRFGRTALQAAAESRHEGIVKFLIALQGAAQNGHEGIVKFLIGVGADVNAPACVESGRTALQAAAENGHEGIVKFLIGVDADVNAPAGTQSGLTALQAAAKSGHEGIVKFLIDAGTDANAPAGIKGGRTALQAAARIGSCSIVQTLISHGANVNDIRNGSKPALISASWGGHLEVVRLLLRAGANPNLSSDLSICGSALRSATRFEHLEIMNLLIDHGADLNNADSIHNHGTACDVAVSEGKAEAVKLLLSRGAEVNLNSNGEPYHDFLGFVPGENCEAIVQLLREHVAQGQLEQ
ncbi:MAG: hypothetical protein M1833_003159 [Piccolia ochrophora]|nr:MAG: hypothetical protein M1833_003159 [Piccolia ochrophora]